MYFNCHTYFSFKYGTLSPESLFNEARKNKVRKLVLSDINNTSAWIEMLRLCNENAATCEMEIVPGIEFRLEDRFLFIAIAMNNEGFMEINNYLTLHNLNNTFPEEKAPAFSNALVIYPFGSLHPSTLRENEYIGIKPHEVRLISLMNLEAYTHKMVIWQPVTFTDKISHNVHRLLRAMDKNTILSKLSSDCQARSDEVMVPEPALLRSYWQYPEIIAKSQQLMESCSVKFELGTSKNKKTFLGTQGKDHYILRKKALEGFQRRYKKYNDYAMERLLRELDVIAKRNFEAYFLIALDVVEFARQRKFAHVGRGSGANSMVAYCLGITDVDPIELDLYFERFLNPYRSSPPDFDIDFSWNERDTVTEYLLDKYKGYAALLATYVTFQGRSIIRELGKVFGLPKHEIDALVQYPAENQGRDDITRLIFRYADRLHDMPQNLSIHAGGVLITELPITAYTALDLPPKGFPVTHFDMMSAEDLGIYKFDILSQRGLGHIRDTIDVVRRNKGTAIDISQVRAFKEDPKLNRLLEQGRAMGCFYIESPAMRLLLRKLHCNNYLTLVAASSIIRPGVARSGMMREYIQRHLNPGKFGYIHPLMKELMEETYGIMVYQEDVIKVAHHFAGLDLAEADVLRRAMSGKYRSRKEFTKVKDRFFSNCKNSGYPDEITNEVWRQIESFSGYSFSKAHSASYAVESYQSLFLKTYYPLEFMVGVINNFGGFYRTEFYFHEARMNGADIEAPCVNRSDYLTTIYGNSLYVGLIHLKGLDTGIGKYIPEERMSNGNYKSLNDFLQRVSIGLEQTCLLIRVGAFRFTGKNKRELLWESHFFFGKSKNSTRNKDLFNLEIKKFELPRFEKELLEDAFDEIELLGFPLCNPFLLLASENKDEIRATDLEKYVNKTVVITGYLVTIKYTQTIDLKPMHFGTFIDREGIFFDTTHFPNASLKYPFRGNGFYKLKGLVTEDFGCYMIEVKYMEKLPMATRKKVDEIPGVATN